MEGTKTGAVAMPLHGKRRSHNPMHVGVHWQRVGEASCDERGGLMRTPACCTYLARDLRWRVSRASGLESKGLVKTVGLAWVLGLPW